MRAVCLFDIDGTLLSTGGAGQRAMERALTQVCGIAEIRGEVLAAGRTDRAILSDLFAMHEVENTPALWRQLQETYLQLLSTELVESPGRVLPGMEPLLQELSGCADVALGLLTGNFRDGAAIKLKQYRIDHYFGFGGYGDDHHDRDDVARLAFQAAVQHLQREIAAETVWVIGDTPSDVRCARAIGAKAVAVATGIYSYDELAQTTPDHVYHDISDYAPLMRSILG